MGKWKFPEFWVSYETMLDTPLDSAIRGELEEGMKLEEEFWER